MRSGLGRHVPAWGAQMYLRATFPCDKRLNKDEERNRSVRTVTKSAIKAGLRRLGLARGDIVVVHSSLSSFGKVKGGAGAVVDALLETIGPEGCLLVPSAGTDAVYDFRKTRSSLGAVTEEVRRRKGAVRSMCPCMPAVALGAGAEEFVGAHHKCECPYIGSPWHLAAEAGGYVLLLGVDQDRNTTLHVAEALAAAAYMTPARRKYVDDNGDVRVYQGELYAGPHRNFVGMDRRFEQAGILRRTMIGTCVARIMKSKDMIEYCLAELEKDPALFITGNNGYEDDIVQRGMIRAARVSLKETFTLIARASSAGANTEEILWSATRAGVSGVEADIIDGRDVTSLSRDDLAWFRRRMRTRKLTVDVVRPGRLTDSSFHAALRAGVELGARAVIWPMTGAPEDLKARARAAKRAGLALLLENGRIASEQAAELIRAVGLGVGLAFNPANFAAAGEYPFRASFKALKRHIRYVAMSDASPTGIPCLLGQGYGEVKEIVSALRCVSWDGFIGIGAAPAHGLAFDAMTDAFYGELDNC